jgi:DedD protein
MNGVDAGMTEANEQHEPSYYEIALTNRQVMAAFVILLLCVLGAFFSGVWVGRGGKGDRRAASSASQAQATPPGQPMQELQFFTPKGEKPAEKPPAVASPETSLATDLGKSTDAPTKGADTEPAPALTDAAPAPVAPPPAASKPVTSPAESTVPTASVPTAPAKPAAASTAPSTAAPTTATPATPATAAAKPATPVVKTSELAPGEMVVQVFSSSDGEQAKKTVQRVNKGGFKAYVSPLQVGTQTMYRVRIGPFNDRAAAQKVADQVRKRFKLDTWITR